VLRSAATSLCLAAMAAYVVGLASAWVAGGVVLVTLTTLGVGEALLVWRESRESRESGASRRPAPSRPLLATPLAMTAALAAGAVLCGLVLAAREDPAADDLGSPAWLLAPVTALLLMAMAWLIGLVVAALVVAPLAMIGSGAWSLVRGGGGWSRVAVGVWLLSIGGYPTCLSLAGDGPRRSLGFAPLLGIDTTAWTITEPALLWPARLFALLTWGPVAAAIVLALVSRVRARGGRPGAAP
jgi:hypothetical protein